MAAVWVRQTKKCTEMYKILEATFVLQYSSQTALV